MENQSDGEEELRVAGSTEPEKLSWAIKRLVEDRKDVVLSMLGVMATTIAVKAVILANGHLSPVGLSVTISPHFARVDPQASVNGVLRERDGGELTLLRFRLKVQKV